MDQDKIDQLNESISQMTDTMNLFRETMQEVISTNTRASKGLGDLNKSLSDTDGYIDQFEKSLKEADTSLKNEQRNRRKLEIEEREAKQKRDNALNSALQSSVSAFGAFGDALISSERSFSKYNSAIGSGTDALASLVSVLSPVGKAFSALIQIVGFVAQGANKLNDSLVTATDQLKSVGAVGTLTSEEFLNLANNSGVTSENFELLTKPIRSLGSGLTAIGATAGDGAKQFMQIAEVLPEVRMSFRRLGVDQGQLIESQAEYLALQRATGRQIFANNRSTEQVQKASLAYTKNLVELEALTGKNVDQLQKEMQAALAREEYMIQNALIQQEINHLTREGATEAERERAASLERELMVRDKFVTEISSRIGSKDLDTAIMQMIASGGAIYGEEAANLSRMLGMSGESFERFRRAIESGDEGVIDDFLNTFKEAQSTTIGSLREAAILGGQEVRDSYFLTAEGMIFNAARAGQNEVDAREKAMSDIERAMKEEFDTIISGRAALTETEIQAAVLMDQTFYPAAEVLATGFMKLNGIVNELANNFEKILGYVIPGYESTSELQGDILSYQETIEENSRKLTELASDNGLFSQTRRNIAQNSINSALDNQAIQAVKLLEKGGTVDESILQRVIGRVEKQLSDSEKRIDVGEREEIQRRLDILRGSTSTSVARPTSSANSDYLSIVAQLESSGNPNARARTSSASGLYQVTDDTWNNAVSQMGKDWTLEDKNDPNKQREVVEYLYNQQKTALTQALQREPTDQEMYIAHFLGQSDAIKFLQANQNNSSQSAQELLPAAAGSNPVIFSEGSTVEDVYNTLNEKYNRVARRLEYSTNQNLAYASGSRSISSTPNTDITPDSTTDASAPASSTTPSSEPVNTTQVYEMNQRLMDVLIAKLDAMIARLDESLDNQDRSFRHNAV